MEGLDISKGGSLVVVFGEEGMVLRESELKEPTGKSGGTSLELEW
jgi:hypothetical protein